MSLALARKKMGRKRRAVSESGGPPPKLGSIKVEEDVLDMLHDIADAEHRSIAEVASSALRENLVGRHESALEVLQARLKARAKKLGPRKSADK